MEHLGDLLPVMRGPDDPSIRYKVHLPPEFCCGLVFFDLKKKDEIINVRPLGDIHIGNLGCDVTEFQKSLDWVAEKENHFTIGMGDYIDNVMAYAQGGVDKRWNPETVDRSTLTTEEQTDKLVEMWGKLPTPDKSRAWSGSSSPASAWW